MTKTTYALLAMLGVGVSLACNNRTDAPPEFNGPLTTSDNSTTVMPFRLVKHEKASASGGAASTETTATADKSGGSTAGTVAVKDSTPQELAETMVEILKSGISAQLAELVVPEQKEAIEQGATAAQAYIDAMAEAKKALNDKFPGHSVQIPDMGEFLRGVMQGITITDIKLIDDDNAEGTTHTPSPTGDVAAPIKFKKIEGKWRYVSSQIEDGTMDKQVALLKALAEAVKGVTQKISDGELADAKAADAELGKAIVAAAGGGAGGPNAGSGDNSADSKEEKPADSKKDDKPAESKGNKPKNDQPDPLDGTVTGPTLRRR